jgi:hypothetical protein
MRTTLTIDDELAGSIERLRQQRGVGLRQVINDLLRKGLLAEAEWPEPKAYVVPTFKTGLRPGIDPARMNQLVDELEVDDFLRR